MREKILCAIRDAERAVSHLAQHLETLEQCVHAIVSCLQAEGKLLIAGNGGSLCDAMHFAEELTGFFRQKRPALPAIALADPGHLSCVSNDLGFEHVFARALEALGTRGDLFIALTTSGQSLNLIRAIEVARHKGLKTIAFLGKGGGALRGWADFEILIEGCITSDRVQEAHMAAMHILIEMVERVLFPKHVMHDEALHVAHMD